MINETVSLKNIITDVTAESFTLERAPTTVSNSREFDLFDSTKNIDFTLFKKEEKFTHENHQCGVSKKIMGVIEKRDKSLETLRLVEKRREKKQTRNVQFSYDSNLS